MEKRNNRKHVYFSHPLWGLYESTPKGEFSSRLNDIVERYLILIKMVDVDLTDNEKMLLSAVFSGSELNGQNFKMHLSNMTWSLEDAGLDSDPDYKGLLEKVEKASLFERAAMIEAVGL